MVRWRIASRSSHVLGVTAATSARAARLVTKTGSLLPVSTGAFPERHAAKGKRLPHFVTSHRPFESSNRTYESQFSTVERDFGDTTERRSERYRGQVSGTARIRRVRRSAARSRFPAREAAVARRQRREASGDARVGRARSRAGREESRHAGGERVPLSLRVGTATRATVAPDAATPAPAPAPTPAPTPTPAPAPAPAPTPAPAGLVAAAGTYGRADGVTLTETGRHIPRRELSLVDAARRIASIDRPRIEIFNSSTNHSRE